MTEGASRLDAFASEPAIRRSAVLAAAIWVGMHVVHALVYADAVAHPLGTALGLLVIVLGSALAVRPMWCRSEATPLPGEAVLAAVSVPLASVLDLTSAVSGSVLGYANWANGAAGVVLLALVLRRHGWLGITAGLLLVALQTTAYVRLPGPAAAATLAQLAVPTSVWLVGSWAVRRALSRARSVTSALASRRLTDAAERMVGEQRVRSRASRLLDLEEDVLRALHRVLDHDPDQDLPEELRSEIRAVASELRDALLARSLVSRDLRRLVQAARARGTRVTLHNELESGPAVDALRTLVARLLELPSLTALSVRTFAEPAEATLVLRGDPGFGEVGLPAVVDLVGGETAHWSRTQVHDLDGDVMVRLTDPAGSASSQSVAGVTRGS